MLSQFADRYGVWLAVGAMVVATVLWIVWPRRKFRRQMAARPTIETRQLLDAAFADDRIDHAGAIKFLEDLAAYFSIPVGKLRLEDAFSKELAPRRGWRYDDELGVVEDYIVTVAKMRNIEIDPRKLGTIKECVACLFARRDSDV